MNKDQMIGKWHELKGSVRQQWGKLTDDDVAEIDGNRERLCGKLQQSYGYAREKAEEQVKAWEASLDRKSSAA